MLRIDILLCFLALATVTHAATWVVSSNADSGAGTLRNTIASAVAGDVIKFAAPMHITLTSGTILIDKGLYINGDVNGNGIADDVTISGNYQYLIFQVSSATQTVTFYGLKLIRGSGVQGGAIFAYGNNVAINRCYIAHCSSVDNGGAVAVSSFSSVTNVLSLVYTTFYNNSARDTGGALAMNAAYARITSCLFQKNKAYAGGAISHFNTGQSTVYESTFSGNVANPIAGLGDYTKGGAIWNSGTSFVSINRCTFSGNDAQGVNGIGDAVYTDTQAHVSIYSSIFADGGDEFNGPGTFTSQGYNLMQQSVFPPAQATDFVGSSAADIGLSPLANNGGLSWTHALIQGSLAVDNGDPGNTCATCVDQRGPGYLRLQGLHVDIGAYESPFSGQSG